MRPYILILVCSSALTVGLSQTTTITFDGEPPQPRGTQSGSGRYEESGTVFQQGGRGQVSRNGGGLPLYPENGTAYLQIGGESEVELALLSGLPFSLTSIDLAEYSTVYPGPQPVFIQGYRADGQGVSTTFMLDGVIDGTGPLPDFETFAFDPTFADVTRVLFPPGVSIDNVVFTPVPEAKTGTLIVAGLAAMIALRWRSAKAQ